MWKLLFLLICSLLCSCSYGTVGQVQSLCWYKNYDLEKLDLMDPDSIPQLIEATHDFNRRIQINALHALGYLRPHSISAMPRAMEMIRSPKNPRIVKIAAVDFFYQLGPFVKGEVDGLGKLLLSEKDREVRVHIIHALGSIGSPQALPLLRRVKDQETGLLAKAAALAIKRIRSFDIVGFCEEKTRQAIKKMPTLSYTNPSESTE